jgi:hypothetical protein
LADLDSIHQIYVTALEGILYDAELLAARLKCQRGVYEVDKSVQIGDRYDDEMMVDVKYTDFENPIVSCVISRGLVKRPYKCATQVLEVICKARVLVEDSKDELMGMQQ